MHYFLITHLFHAQQNSVNYCLDFIVFEFVLGFYFVMQTSSAQQFEYNVERVLWLENLEKSHVVWMTQVSHNLDFLYQTLLSFLFTVSGLFRKGFDSVSVFVLMLFNQVNWSEVSFSDFVEGFELFMEASLVQSNFQKQSPGGNIFLWVELIGELSVSFLEEDFPAFRLESEFQIKVKVHTLLWCFVIKSVLINLYFRLGSLPAHNGWAQELSRVG